MSDADHRSGILVVPLRCVGDDGLSEVEIVVGHHSRNIRRFVKIDWAVVAVGMSRRYFPGDRRTVLGCGGVQEPAAWLILVAVFVAAILGGS